VVQKAKQKKWKTLGNYIRKKRIESGYSQGSAMRLINSRATTPQYLSNMERGICAIPDDILRKMISLYKIDTDEFIEELLSIEKSCLYDTFKIKSRAQ